MAAERPFEGMEAGDLARLREIAEEGRSRPLLGGASLVVWGTAIALASLLGWSVLARLVVVPGWSVSLIWFGLMLGAGLLSAISKRGHVHRPAAMSTGNRVSLAVWRMVGSFLGTLAVGLTLYTLFGGREVGDGAQWAMMSVMAPVTFGAFGIALAATAVSADAPWLLRYAWLSLAFTVATAALLGQLVQHLVMAAGAIAVGVLPGLRMIKAARDG